MLLELHIKNIAIIKDIEIHFGKGLNILTGETGAGKTVILNSLELILGGRSYFDVIRTVEKSARVQAIFTGGTVDVLNKKSLQLGLFETSDSDEVIITREIDVNSRSRAKVNGERILLNQLQALTLNTIDIHSQHQHQSLLSSEVQRDILDLFSNLKSEKSQVKEILTLYRILGKRIADIENENREILKQKEFFEFEINKIEDTAPIPGEDEKIKQELKLVKNSELLFDKLKKTVSILYEEDDSVVNQINKVIFENNRTSQIDNGIDENITRLKGILSDVEDISYFFRDYLKSIDFTPDHVEELNSRLSNLEDLKRRFKKDLPGILEYKEQLKNKLSSLADFKINFKNDLIRQQELETELGKLVLDLSRLRSKAAVKLAKKIEKSLNDLNMNSVKFSIAVKKRELDSSGFKIKGKFYDISDSGIDDVKFLISPNKGEDLRSLEKIVSGGELSRIMLAIKDVFAEKNHVKILIFDEIDSGIGGKTAEVVGRRLKELSKSVQVIVITHLPQIAKFADNHFLIEKLEDEDRTITTIKLLNEKLRKLELARMLGGEEITDLTLKHAEELLKKQ